MATVSGASRRYAQALFSLARDQGKLDEWFGQLQRAASLFQIPEAEQALTSPAVDAATKQALLDRALPDLDEPVRRLLRILNGRGRLELVPEILSVYQRLLYEHRNVAVAQVVTAFPLSAEEQRLVAERLARYLGKQVVIEPEVDPAIIGGVVARVDDLLLDDSVRGRLARLRRALVG